eukprot:scaffold10909_cov172-Amphora_coffeaeformis.AAC.9
MMLPVLEGRIQYTLRFSPTTKDGPLTTTTKTTSEQHASVVGRKRKANEMTGGALSNDAASITSTAADSSFNFPLAGWTFTHQTTGSSTTTTCLAMLPAGLVALAVRAQEQNARVRICRYKYQMVEWELPNGNRIAATAVDIHPDGLQSLEPLSLLEEHQRIILPPALTLAQLAKLEYLEAEIWKKSSRRCSVVGRVEAVSPIITVDSNDPFCLVELEQYTERANYSLVIVLRKESLIRWPALQPGSSVTFYEAVRQAWGVPKWLAPWRPRRTPPERVLVVERPTQIGLTTTDEFMLTENSCIQGKIVDIRLLHLSKKHTAIHFVKLDSSVYIFMAYFPMDSSLRSSIQLSAEIKAFSLRCLEQNNAYEATIRSSIVVTKLASSSLDNRTTKDPNITLQCHPFYFARKIKVLCLESWYRLQTRNWVNGVLCGAGDDGCASENLADAVYQHLYHSNIQPSSITHNPYSRFFECHESTDEPEIDCQPESSVDSKPEGDSSSLDLEDETFPKLFTLGFLRGWAMSQIRQQLVKQQTTVDLPSPGWMGSVILEFTEVAANSRVYAGGTIERSPAADEKVAECVSLKNGGVSVSVALDQVINQSVGKVALVELKSVVASLVCLCPAAESTKTCDLDLPKYDTEGPESPVGCNRILVVGGMIFMCCIVFRGDNAMLFSTNQISAQATNPQTKNVCTRFQTIEDCLYLPSSVQSPEDQVVSSLLVRKSIRFCKARHGKFNGLCLTLCNFSLSDFDVEEAVSSIQSIEMKPAISIENTKRWKMKQILEQGFIRSCSPELMDTATAFWKLADDTLCCPMVMGGWDEITTANIRGIAGSCGVQVLFPSDSVERDRKRGYVRFRCSLDALQSSFVLFRPERTAKWFGRMSPFDFTGGEKFFPGMLDRRPLRVGQKTLSCNENSLGPLARCPRVPYVGIVQSSLTDLHTYTCLDLQQSSRLSLEPSLVREIRGRFLGVSFCEVFAECTKCFQRLVRLKGNSRKNGNATNGGSNKTLDLPSYWHQAIRSDTARQEVIIPRQTSDPLPSRIQLSCRNGCEQKNFAIRWECSGTLDDGTGQAKLYAERAAAVTLLGMDKRTIDTIEDGVWNLEGGLTFCRSVPVKPYIRTAVETAKSLAYADLKSRRKSRSVHLDEEAVLRCMSPACRAEYLLHVHCRKSTRPLRPLVYYVRCKPLSDEVRMVNHTELTLVTESGKQPESGRVQAVPHKSVSYALPPLKLNLVDMAMPNERML